MADVGAPVADVMVSAATRTVLFLMLAGLASGVGCGGGSPETVASAPPGPGKGPTDTGLPPPPAPDGDPALLWSLTMRDANGVAVNRLEVGEPARLKVQLGASALKSVSSHPASAKLLRQWTTLKRLRVRAYLDAAIFQELTDLPPCTITLSAGDAGGSCAEWEVEAAHAGATGIDLVVWREQPGPPVPIDHIQLPFTVGDGPLGSDQGTAASLSTPRRDPDVSLQLASLNASGTIYAGFWAANSTLDDSRKLGNLRRAAKQATTTLDGGETAAWTGLPNLLLAIDTVGHATADMLFGESGSFRTGVGKLLSAVLDNASKTGKRPRIYVHLSGVEARALPIESILAAELLPASHPVAPDTTLGDLFDFELPLPSRAHSNACVSAYRSAVPTAPTETDFWEELKEEGAERPTNATAGASQRPTPGSINPITWWTKNATNAGPGSPFTKVQEPTVFTLLGHFGVDGAGRWRFGFRETGAGVPLDDATLPASFPAPSVAFLNGCSTTPLGEDALARTLNRRGIVALIGTTAALPIPLMVDAHRCWTAQVAGLDEATALRTVYDNMLNCVARAHPGDESEATDQTLRWGRAVRLYRLHGDGDVQLCGRREDSPAN
ncbi:MAG: hypothetical protein Q8P41_20280 [Pseudomonadota bacterium]|nr:hypothetical protein [Pseudomonadota bacterium]